VNDLVVDLQTGKISYVAMSFGGVLGIGEKLFAVPFNQLRFAQNDNGTYFVLSMSKEKLKAAPGFDKSHWPNFADPNWSQHIDQYYREHEVKTGAVNSQ
jgi:hypothetical protein